MSTSNRSAARQAVLKLIAAAVKARRWPTALFLIFFFYRAVRLQEAVFVKPGKAPATSAFIYTLR